ncbi:MAG: ATP synthase F1 subunit epsilon [Planctomycetota bacterium]|jgi:F-type H+-transporting ATPase subunit epsilon
MRFKLMTPELTLFEGEVESVSGRAPDGDFEIREGHAPWVSPLVIDVLTIGLGEGKSRTFAVHGGLAEVGPESVLVLADLAEAAGDIDSGRAERALDRAKGHLAGTGARDADIDAERARRAMDRAAARLEAETLER